MTENVFPLFKKLRSTLPASTNQKPYKAFVVSDSEKTRSEMSLLVCGLGGDPDYRLIISYSYLMEVCCSADEHLSLIYTNSVVTLTGRNLTELIEPLQDLRLRAVHCFIPELYLEPLDAEDEVIIHSITSLSIDDWWRQYLEQRSEKDQT